MFYGNYINVEFSDYLNRYLNGITILKEKLKRVSVSYELSEAFSNHACRFFIDVDFRDFNSLTEKEKQTAHKHFHNMWNSTGNKFVSFSYKPQRSHWVDFEEIKLFITHYQFAEAIFNGFVKDALPTDCVLKIESLEDEPLFLYADDFLHRLQYAREQKELEQEYRTINGRSFDFDCSHHKIFIETAKQYDKIDDDNCVTDKELFKAQGCYMEDLRRFVLSEEIPFNIDNYNYVIDIIKIDASKLLEKTKRYTPKYSFERIDPLMIAKFLEQKEKEKQLIASLLQRKEIESGIQVGHYIYVEKGYWGKECSELGIVKETKLNYNNQLEVVYNVLKNNLQESKLPLKTTRIDNISHSISASHLKEAKQNLAILQKVQLIRFLQQKGTANTFYKKSKKVRSK